MALNPFTYDIAKDISLQMNSILSGFLNSF